MRVALVTPAAFPSVRGNAVTVSRLARGLVEHGVDVVVLDLARTPESALPGALAAAAPDLIHAFHAFWGGRAVAPVARERRVPLVVSLTGTDANHDLFDHERRPVVIESLETARGIVAFHETIRTKVAVETPSVAAQIAVIPQSAVLGGEPCPAADLVPRHGGEVRFLLPAGIRRVKDVLAPFGPLGSLARRHPLRLLLAGPVIEETEGARLAAHLEDADWASYLGEVPHAQMGSLLDAVDIVLNCSLSEGGMANSVLEAMSRGRPVLASDIEGNRSLIEDGVDGLLYRDAADLERQAERLLRDPALGARLGRAARAKVERLYSRERETRAYLALYRCVLTAASTGQTASA